MKNGGIMPRLAFLNDTTCNRTAVSSCAETSTSSNFSVSSDSTNFSVYTSEVESGSEANSSEASPWSLCRIV